MRFWTNVAKILTHRKISMRALAREVGVTPGALSSYSRGTVPSLEVAVRIATYLGVSMDALIWGDDKGLAPPLCSSPAEHALYRELRDELGLEDMVLLSKLSSQGLSWKVAQVLLEALPEALPMEVLRQKVGEVEEDMLRASILSLKRQGMIDEVTGAGGVSYAFRSGEVRFQAQEVTDRTQHTKFAARLLFGRVLPRLLNEDKTAHLTSLVAKVPRGHAEQMSSDLFTFISNRMVELGVPDGLTEISIVFAVALHDDVC